MAQINLSEIKAIVLQYVAELQKKGIQVDKIVLFGSYAKGAATISSDIDLVVISSDLAKWAPITRLQMLSQATWHIDAPLEVFGYTPEEIRLKGNQSIFWAEISKTGQEIYKRAA
jgi:predicted nucleotidyltransferase